MDNGDRHQPALRLRPRSLPALLTAGAIGLAGCGSTPLSPAQLRRRATTMCVRANRRLQAINAPQTASGARPFLQQGSTALAGELAQLRTLDASGEPGHVYQAALSAVGSELTAIHQTVGALRRGADALTALHALAQRLTPLESQADEAWRALQIPACATR